jgi:hypothetical protein
MRSYRADRITAAVAVVIGCSCSGRSSPPPTVESQIAARIAVRESPTIFTLFAFLNAAGYDEENRPAMHPVRLHVRRALDSRLPAQLRTECQAYYAAHDSTATPWTYAVVAMATSGPPDFSFGSEWTQNLAGQAEFAQLSELPALLRRFVAAVPVDSLYRSVRAEYVHDVEAYQRVIRREVEAAVAYCRVRDARELAGGGETPHAIVIPNLLESNERAFSFVLADTFYAVEGPQPQLGYNPHEFIHAITNPMSYDPAHAPAQARAESLFVVARQVTGGEDEAHASLAAWMDEELVRAIALRYGVGDDATRLAHAEASMLREWRRGHLLERFWFEQLGEYEKSHGTLREEYPHMLGRLNGAREMQRWREAQSSR